jgi:Zn-dependent M28 family amino/carboxypeptidase
LRNYGAKAVLIGGTRSDNDVDYGGAITMDSSIAPLPIARVGREDLALMVRLLKKGPVAVQFSYKNRIRRPGEAENVVAEIKGREKPDEFVIVGAHLDSVQVGTGAQDDGAGVASVLEAARAIKASGVAPRRSIRFVLFGGEEEWELGSKAYAAQHEKELGKCAAVLITDTGSDTPHGWYINGREDEVASLQAIAPVLEPVGGSAVSKDSDYLLHSDHTAFLLRGVPTLMLWTEMTTYFHYVHQPGDTYDKIEKEKLAKGTAIVAATAFAIADSTEPFASHLSHAEIEELLKATKKYEGYLDLEKHSATASAP